MEHSVSSQLLSLVNFAKSFHLYNRYQLAKDLKSPLVYGEGFGSAETLRKAKEDFLKHQEAYNARDTSKDTWAKTIPFPDEAKMPYGNAFIFKETEATEEPPVALTLELFASHKKLEDFFGKDYVLDISPESLHIIFPDLTFIVPIQALIDTPWELLRTELQENELLEKDTAHLSGEMVSLDDLRKKLKDTASTDGKLTELRKKMYGLAYAINDSFQNNIERYEK